MAFTYRNTVQRPLTFGEHDANLDEIEKLHREAVEAADAAIAAGNIYVDTTAGLAATAEGAYFSVPSGLANNWLSLYRKVSGAASLIKTYFNPGAFGTAALEGVGSSGSVIPMLTYNPIWTGATHTIRNDACSWSFESVSRTNRYRLFANISDAVDDRFNVQRWNGSAHVTMLAVGDGVVGINTGANVPGATLDVNGFTRLGEAAPSIKTKKLSGTSGSTTGSTVTIAHGIDVTKILAITGMMKASGVSDYYAPNYALVAANLWYLRANATNAVVVLGTGATAMTSQPFSVFITYEA